MFCVNCGHKMGNVNFCSECGAKKFSHENKQKVNQVLEEEKGQPLEIISPIINVRDSRSVENKQVICGHNGENHSFMSLMIQSYKKFLMNAFNFRGKATRKEYWLAMLASTIIAISVYLIEMLSLELGVFVVFGILYAGMIIYSIFIGIAGLSIMARRCGDAGVSRWWLLSAFLSIIPVIGAIVFLIIWLTIACKPSKVQA